MPPPKKANRSSVISSSSLSSSSGDRSITDNSKLDDMIAGETINISPQAVSYTHLDVYKRQQQESMEQGEEEEEDLQEEEQEEVETNEPIPSIRMESSGKMNPNMIPLGDHAKRRRNRSVSPSRRRRNRSRSPLPRRRKRQ